MKRVVVAACVAAVFAFASGFATVDRRSSVDGRLCTLNTTLVSILDSSLDGVTVKEAKKYPKQYERERSKILADVQKIVKQAQCKITINEPPDLLAPPLPSSTR